MGYKLAVGVLETSAVGRDVKKEYRVNYISADLDPESPLELVKSFSGGDLLCHGSIRENANTLAKVLVDADPQIDSDQIYWIRKEETFQELEVLADGERSRQDHNNQPTGLHVLQDGEMVACGQEFKVE